MKVIIAGSRTIWRKPETIQRYVEMFEEELGGSITELVCGMAPDGIDACALDWRDYHNRNFDNYVEIAEFPADWEGFRAKFGTHKGAGYARNRDMADYADALILIWDGESPGSASMKALAEERGLPILEVKTRRK